MDPDNRIESRHLVCFLEVTRQRSFAKVADAATMSQSTISKIPKGLEGVLDVRLFERSKAGTELTGAGVTLLHHADPCVQVLRDEMNTLRSHKVQVETVWIGVLSTVEDLVVPEMIRRLYRRHDALAISVIIGPNIYPLVQSKVGELGLVAGRMTDNPGIQGPAFEHLCSESMMLVVRPGHPLLTAPLGDSQRLAEFPLVLPLTGITIRRHVDSLFVQRGISFVGQCLETLSPILSRSYVLRSKVIWVVPRNAVYLDVGNGESAELDPGIREPGGSVGLHHDAALPLSLGVRWPSVMLREVVAESH